MKEIQFTFFAGVLLQIKYTSEIELTPQANVKLPQALWTEVVNSQQSDRDLRVHGEATPTLGTQADRLTTWVLDTILE